MKPKFTNPSLPRLALVFTMVLSPLVANGADLTWDGDQDANWNTDNAGNTNWTDSALPGDALPMAGDSLSFGGVTNTATFNDVAAGTIFAGIAFTNDGTATTQDAAFTLTGNSITLGAAITTTATTVGTLEDTIDIDLILNGGRSILARTGHTLKITGDISSDGLANHVLSVGDNANPVNDEARVTLSGNNTHFQTRISRTAEARAESNTALGASVNMIRQSALYLANGIDLTATGGINGNGGAGSPAILLTDDGASTASINANTPITNNTSAGLAFNTGEDDTLTVNSLISEGGDIVKNGVGTLVLTNPLNSGTGTTNVNAGTLTLSGGTLGATTASLSMSGGTIDLGGSSQTVSRLNILGAAASGDTISNGTIAATDDLTVPETPILAFNGNIGAGNAIIAANLTDGASTASFTKSGAGIVTLTGINTYTGTTTSTQGSLVAANAAALPGYTTPGTVIFDGGTIGVQVSGSGWTPGEVDALLANATKNSGGLGIDTTNGNFTQSAAFTPATLGTLGLTKLGINSLTLDKVNTYTGGTTLTMGTLNINNASALGAEVGSTFFVAETTTIDNTSGSAVTLNNDPSVILPGDGFTFGGTNNLSLGAGTVQLNLPPNNSTRIITLGGSGSTLTLGHSFSPARGGNTNIQVDGAGNTLVFASLGLNDAGANRTNEWSGSGNVTVNGGVLDGGDGGQRFTYSGTGTFSIGGTSNYTGITTLNSGTLALTATGSLSDETDVTINGGIIDLDAAVNDTIKSLTITAENGGSPLDPGTYGSSTSGATNAGIVGDPDLYFSGNGIFTIPATDPYEAWAGNAVFVNDANGDGVSNGMAWLLGAMNIQENALPLLPEPVVSGGALTMEFAQVTPIAPAKLFIEYSNDLGVSDPWHSVEVPTTTDTVNGVDFVIEGGTISVSIPDTEALGGKLFTRLSANEN